MRSKSHRQSVSNKGRNDWWPPEWGPWQHDVTHESLWTDDLVIDSGNNGHNWQRSSSLMDVGGDLFIIKRYYRENGTGPVSFRGRPDGDQTRPYQEVSNLSAKFASVDNGSFPWGWSVPAPNWLQMDVLGTEGINKTIPTKPVTNMATALAELSQDGLPKAMLIAETGKRRTQRSLNAGDEYLNVEFGWKPLVRDVRAFAQSVLDREEILSRYRSKSGTKLRRTYRWDDEYDSGEWSEGSTAPQPALYSGLYNHSGSIHLTAKSVGKVETWFVATYQYFVPQEKTPEGMLSDAHHLLGVKLTPETLWNAAPWTWAADWVANTGTILENLSAINQDSLVIHHAYVMRKHTVTYTYVNELRDAMYSLPGTHRLVQEFTTEIKSRRRASPYGFGLTWDGFTSSQLAILGALGVSRLG